jgi:hypothetical protein
MSIEMLRRGADEAMAKGAWRAAERLANAAWEAQESPPEEFFGWYVSIMEALEAVDPL